MKTKKYANKSSHLLFKFLCVFVFTLTAAFSIPHRAYAVDSYSFSPTWAGYVSNNKNEDVKLTEAGCAPGSTSSCGQWAPGDTIGSYNYGIPTGKNIVKINLKKQSGAQLGADDRLDWLVVTYTAFSTNGTNYNSSSQWLMFNQGGSVSLNNSTTTYYEPVAVLSHDTGSQDDRSGGNSAGINETMSILYRVLPSTKGRTGDTTLLQQIYIPTTNGTDLWFNVKSAVMVSDYSAYFEELNDHAWEIEQLVREIAESGTSEKIDEARDEAETAQQQTETSGGNSQQGATTDGQTLLGAFTSFVNAIAGASPSNCNINMDTGFIDFGIVNLCQLSPPPAFQVISSIVVIGFAIPLSLACARKIIELFRSFQN